MSLFHKLVNTWYFLYLIFSNLMNKNWYLSVVLICTFLIMFVSFHMLISQSFFLLYEMSFCVFCLFPIGLFLLSGGIEGILGLILALRWLCIAGEQVSHLSLSLVFLLWWQESLILMSCQHFSLWFVAFVSFKRNHSPKVMNAFTHIASRVLRFFLSYLRLWSMEN